MCEVLKSSSSNRPSRLVIGRQVPLTGIKFCIRHTPSFGQLQSRCTAVVALFAEHKDARVEHKHPGVHLVPSRDRDESALETRTRPPCLPRRKIGPALPSRCTGLVGPYFGCGRHAAWRWAVLPNRVPRDAPEGTSVRGDER